MQGRTAQPGSACQTPNFDRLAARGVLQVEHCVDDDQCNLRTDQPHWAERLRDAGYQTACVGKWHIERSSDLERYGWNLDCTAGYAEYHGTRFALEQRVFWDGPWNSLARP